MPTPVENFLLQMLGQAGDRYEFGAEAELSESDPTAWDCSELIQWAAGTCSPPIEPTVPDGSWLQFRHIALHHCTSSIERAIATRGMVLARFSSSPLEGGRPTSSHIAVSIGDGLTIEARGAAWGVGSWTSAQGVRGWTHAGYLPGVDYTWPAVSFRNLALRKPRMRGTDVLWVQIRLNRGPSGPLVALTEDSIYGPLTEAAVVHWQRAMGLSADGIVGPITWAALQR